MISVVVIYSENDTKYLQGLLQSINFQCEIVLAKTIPANYEKSELENQENDIKKVNIFYDKENFSFAKLRNEANHYASGDWILSIDADERISVDIFEINKIMAMEKVGGIYLTIVNLVTDDKGDIGSFNQKTIRLFRSGLEWKYRCHEQIVESIEKAGYSVAQSSGVIRHVGYLDNKGILQKAIRNTELMCKDVAEYGMDLKRIEILSNTMLLLLEEQKKCQ